MNKFDTLWLRIHESCVKVKPEFEFDFRHQAYPSWGNKHWNSPRFPNSPRINFIAPDSQSVLIGLSSKALGPRFNELISANNVEVVLRELSEYLDFEPKEFLEHLGVGSCDVTSDILVDGPVHRYLLPLACIAHPTFATRRYKNEEVSFEEIKEKEIFDLETVVFQKYALSKEARERITFYDKHKDLLRKSRGRFNKSLPNPNEVLEYYKNRIRVERRISGFEKIRNTFKLSPKSSPRLVDVLNSHEKPLSDLLSRIRNNSKPSLTERYPLKQPLNRLINEFGWEKLINDCKRDPGIIKDFIQSEIKGNHASKMKWIRNRIEAMNLSDLNIAAEESKGLLDVLQLKLMDF